MICRKKKWGSPSIQQKYSHTKLTQRSSALYFVEISTWCARLKMTWHVRHSGKMIAHARLFSRVSSRAVCEWTLGGENKASISPNFKPSVEGNEFYYLKRHWDFDRDASGVICRKLQTVSGLYYVNNIGNFIHTVHT